MNAEVAVDLVHDSGPPEEWSLTETEATQALRPSSRALFALGNGFIGVRGAFEEDWAKGGIGGDAVYLNGIYETVPIRYHERLAGFADSSDRRLAVANPLPFEVYVEGERFSLAHGEVLAYERRLSIQDAVLTRKVRWRSPAGRTVDLLFERLVSFPRTNIIGQRITVTPVDFDGAIEISSGVAAAQSSDMDEGSGLHDPRIGPPIEGTPWRVTAFRHEPTAAAFLLRTQRSGHRVALAVAHTLPFGCTMIQSVGQERCAFRGSAIAQRGMPLSFEKTSAFIGSRLDDDHDLLTDAWQAVLPASQAGFRLLAAEQREHLERFWRNAAVAINGAPDLQRALRFNMLQLVQAAGQNGQTSIAAKGQTGEGYEGHYFWDAEVFCLPVLTFTAPPIARALLEFRWRTLPQARAIARRMMHSRGALFPWRTIGGEECSAYFPAGTAQYHLNAGIGYAVRQYVEVTGDREFLEGMGAELVLETARIWLEVGFFNPRRGGRFCIPGVTGPDEYTALVDNNFYTNAMAQAHLEFAAALANDLARSAPERWSQLCSKLDLSESEIHDFTRAAASMYLPYDESLRMYKQDDTFLDRKPWDFRNVPQTRHPLLLYYHPLVLYRHQVCKQADTVLAMFLLADRFEKADRKRTFDYYERITAHDSTLSPGVFSIVASDVGEFEKALEYARRTILLDVEDLHGNTRDGLHMAAMGASWMCLVYGFAGLRLKESLPSFRPCIPAGLDGYRFRLVVRGRTLAVDVDSRRTSYQLVNGPALRIHHFESAIDLDPINPVASVDALPTKHASRPARPLRSAVAAVIFDLDGVLADTARCHFLAWKRLAAELHIPFDEGANEALKGVDRTQSLALLLSGGSKSYSEQEKLMLAERKNRYYKELVARLTYLDVLPGGREALLTCRHYGIRTALASASRNAPAVLAQIGLQELIDFVVDPNTIANPKPHPEMFLAAARGLNAHPHSCIGIEDAVAGVQAIRAAGMYAIGVGNPDVLLPAGADEVIPAVSAFTLDDYLKVPRSVADITKHAVQVGETSQTTPPVAVTEERTPA